MLTARPQKRGSVFGWAAPPHPIRKVRRMANAQHQDSNAAPPAYDPAAFEMTPDRFDHLLEVDSHIFKRFGEVETELGSPLVFNRVN